MPATLFNQRLAETIAALNRPHFSSKLIATIGTLIEFDCAVIIGYRAGKHPIYLFDSIENERELLFQRYLTASFQNDPFYRWLDSEQQQGVFMLKDVLLKGIALKDIALKDRTQKEHDFKAYCQQFYHQTGWQDELSLLIQIESKRWVMIYLGRTAPKARFATPQINQLKAHFAILQSLAQQHWQQQVFTLAEPVLDAQQPSMDIRLAIERALRSFGSNLLTKREQQIVALIAQGFDSKEIAAQLGVSEGTVKNHRKRIYAQLNVGSLSELFQLFLNHLITQSERVE